MMMVRTDALGIVYHTDEKTFTCDKTDIFGLKNLPEKFWLRSHLTGREIQFRFWKSISDGDGSVEAWLYKNDNFKFGFRICND